jgi:hypothetical protein
MLYIVTTVLYEDIFQINPHHGHDMHINVSYNNQNIQNPSHCALSIQK